MKITWLGHASFRIEIAEAVLLIDPWLTGNPSFPDDRRAEALAGATHILLTHGHFDHASEVADIAGETGATIVGIPELCGAFAGHETVDFNKGGTVDLNGAKVSMVQATHSSSLGTAYAGTEAGYMIGGEGHMIYVSGDTDVMADMGWMAEFYQPDIGILCCGGHYTMGMEGAAFAARKFFDFNMVIPCHYKTFPLLAQSAQPLVDALPDVDVRTPDVMDVIEI
ncbi:metal-dependent hydrolase [Cognatiyoonia sp. IB215446]|uniref:metal-dependent hydrolase n=1 Tax=Cognatiyoonia sp. IB215446 TaxID=3097355 RepID=UPI002A186858|nr:metal-dependent hydrolase [Cognatiyoonia sp. IB215446]MDX8348074.1 metal-dependent hydrolase [Cognatiyoonia sp. IB215446]